MLYTFGVVLSLSCFARALDIITRQGELHIVNKNIAPDGFQRAAVLAGVRDNKASFPGPLIKANKGDQFSINVFDSLTDTTMDIDTSIHWHGLFQHGTNWADGADSVTQCPIEPNESFNYRFRVPDQAGTYWYHSHFRAQYCDGLRGPLVIYDPNDPQKHLYDVDDESTIITLADWYHSTGPQLVALQAPPASDSTLINGLGRWAAGNVTAPLAIVNVQAGKRYRLRLISIACDPSYTFSIDGHNLTVIEADGQMTDPYTVNQIEIFAAQRYSVVLNANQRVGNYWIRALPSENGPQGFANGINSAILRYKGAPNVEPKTNQSSQINALSEVNLHALAGHYTVPGQPRLGGADKVLNLTLGFIPPATFMINNVPFVNPSTPVLLQILSGAQQAQDLLPKGSVYGLPSNKVIEIHLFGNNTAGDPHPMHLHGHAFDVIKSADSDVLNFKNPVRRDTVAVAGNNMTVIRFKSDNPGPWFLHCHIDFHLVDGLAVVLAEDIKDTKLVNPVPPDWSKLCNSTRTPPRHQW